jgi:hypothetical protein
MGSNDTRIAFLVYAASCAAKGTHESVVATGDGKNQGGCAETPFICIFGHMHEDFVWLVECSEEWKKSFHLMPCYFGEERFHKQVERQSGKPSGLGA